MNVEKLTDEQANAIFDILVQECGAREEIREDFVCNQIVEHISEWRFCGKLGFGGKFWRNDGRLYVNCYREDETPAIRKMIEAANKRLKAL